MGHPSLLRVALKGFVHQHVDGVRFNLIQRQFPAVSNERLRRTLYNLQQVGEVYCVTVAGAHGDALWKAGRAPNALPPTTPTEFKRRQRARDADQRDPLVFYGEHVHPPLCSSVWAYARSFQEPRT